jgi:hypothetical protein
MSAPIGGVQGKAHVRQFRNNELDRVKSTIVDVVDTPPGAVRTFPEPLPVFVDELFEVAKGCPRVPPVLIMVAAKANALFDVRFMPVRREKRDDRIGRLSEHL